MGERVPAEGAIGAAGHNHVSQRGHSQAPHRALVRLQAQQLRERRTAAIKTMRTGQSSTQEQAD